MTRSEFHRELERLGLSLNGLARVLGIDDRNVRRWAGGAPIPEYVADRLREMETS